MLPRAARAPVRHGRVGVSRRSSPGRAGRSARRPRGRRTAPPSRRSRSRSARRWRRSSSRAPHGVVVLSEQDLTVLAIANNPHPDEFRDLQVRVRGGLVVVSAQVSAGPFTPTAVAHISLSLQPGRVRPGDRRAGPGGRRRNARPPRVRRLRASPRRSTRPCRWTACSRSRRSSAPCEPTSSASRWCRAESRSACTIPASRRIPPHARAGDLAGLLRHHGEDERRVALHLRVVAERRMIDRIGDLAEEPERPPGGQRGIEPSRAVAPAGGERPGQPERRKDEGCAADRRLGPPAPRGDRPDRRGRAGR